MKRKDRSFEWLGLVVGNALILVTLVTLVTLGACKMPPGDESRATSSLSVEQCIQQAQETRDQEILNGVPPHGTMNLAGLDGGAR